MILCIVSAPVGVEHVYYHQTIYIELAFKLESNQFSGVIENIKFAMTVRLMDECNK